MLEKEEREGKRGRGGGVLSSVLLSFHFFQCFSRSSRRISLFSHSHLLFILMLAFSLHLVLLTKKELFSITFGFVREEWFFSRNVFFGSTFFFHGISE